MPRGIWMYTHWGKKIRIRSLVYLKLKSNWASCALSGVSDQVTAACPGPFVFPRALSLWPHVHRLLLATLGPRMPPFAPSRVRACAGHYLPTAGRVGDPCSAVPDLLPHQHCLWDGLGPLPQTGFPASFAPDGRWVSLVIATERRLEPFPSSLPATPAVKAKPHPPPGQRPSGLAPLTPGPPHPPAPCALGCGLTGTVPCPQAWPGCACHHRALPRWLLARSTGHLLTEASPSLLVSSVLATVPSWIWLVCFLPFLVETCQLRDRVGVGRRGRFLFLACPHRPHRPHPERLQLDCPGHFSDRLEL